MNTEQELCNGCKGLSQALEAGEKKDCVNLINTVYLQ